VKELRECPVEGEAQVLNIDLPRRVGDPPETTHPTHERAIPHQQLSQLAPVELQRELLVRAAALPGVAVADSKVSVPGARAFHLNETHANGPKAAFQRDTEFAHLHPEHDGSLHMTLPPEVFDQVLEAGWGVPHPISGTMLVFGPRDRAEIEIVWDILQASYGWATGQP
jgi:hypothetical protein